MARAQELFNAGSKIYKAGESRGAVLYWAEAASAATKEHNPLLQHEALVWQAVAFLQLGETTRALGRLLAAYEVESENPGAPFKWYAQWLYREHFVLCLMTGANPLTEIQAALAELTALAATHRCSFHDIPVIQGHILAHQGRWVEALAQYETALAQLPGDPAGYIKSYIASRAAQCCIHLHRWAVVEDWIFAIHDEKDRENGFADWISFAQGLARFTLARAQGEDHSRLRLLFQPIEAVSVSMDEGTEERRSARLAVALLDPHGGDPAHGGHPARRALSRLPGSCEDKHVAFGYVRAILDYRLACLRFAAAVPAVDDEYHEAPPPPPLRIADQQDFRRRLKRAGVVLVAAQCRARAIDAAYECDWRQQDIARRARAIDAIACAHAEGS